MQILATQGVLMGTCRPTLTLFITTAFETVRSVTLKNLENSNVERIETFCAAGCAKRSLKTQQNCKDSRIIELHFRRHCNFVGDDHAKSAVRSWPATAPR